ncbi:cobalamin B12-binding domain-containing protein [Streptomyces agglomeratus]|uniref:cobalamin B12-binding domain-containing protein n=1 Tax=Streptomyces agglomeratus TaxID=285458 RepID=UPI000854FBC2|nr:cobalamin B12-binding domain-containing protein [Streptomyces agglomeratus]OEJ36250.1 methylaspartate mutase [Streptomyces agglomeratus]
MSDKGLPEGLEQAYPEPSKGTVIVTSLVSDSHTWNLVFLQLLIEECGYDVVNLGPCVPDELLVSECSTRRPEMIVISSVNGHGYQDGMRVIPQLRACDPLAATPIVIGGKLGTDGGEGANRTGELVAAGFDAVFEDGRNPIAAFHAFLATLPQPAPQAGISA